MTRAINVRAAAAAAAAWTQAQHSNMTHRTFHARADGVNNHPYMSLSHLSDICVESSYIVARGMVEQAARNPVNDVRAGGGHDASCASALRCGDDRRAEQVGTAAHLIDALLGRQAQHMARRRRHRQVAGRRGGRRRAALHGRGAAGEPGEKRDVALGSRAAGPTLCIL